MSETIEAARGVVVGLEKQVADLAAKEIEFSNEAKRISFAALTGDADAKKSLAKIDGDEIRLRQAQRHLRDALEEAKRRLGEAERAEERERLAENAEKANAIAERLVKHARKIDEAFAVISEESNAWLADITGLNQLGISNPRAEQFTVMGGIAANTALMFTPLKFQHVAPNDRRSFSDLASGWSASVSRWAASFLGDKAEAA